MKWFRNLSLRTRKSIVGLLFVSPFIIGVVFFFLAPFVQSLFFSMNKLIIKPGGVELEYVKWDNYSFALFTHPDFIRVFTETVSDMLLDLPLVIIFSIFAALLLNQKFKGRLLARTIFFLPVILSSSVILKAGGSNYMAEMLEKISSENSFISGEMIKPILMSLKIPGGLLDYVIASVDRVAEVIRASGIQILIFLAGLQSIPSSLYEASKVEGATRWENFWLITLPILSPIVLTNVVYTIIDSFLSRENELVTLIKDTAFGGAGFGVSTAMGVMYFGAIAFILAILIGIISRWVFYQE